MALTPSACASPGKWAKSPRHPARIELLCIAWFNAMARVHREGHIVFATGSDRTYDMSSFSEESGIGRRLDEQRRQLAPSTKALLGRTPTALLSLCLLCMADNQRSMTRCSLRAAHDSLALGVSFNTFPKIGFATAA